THRVCASGKLHATRWHLENVCSSCRVEHVRPLQEARERLTILAIANEAEASGRRYLIRDALHVAAPASKRQVYGRACLVIECEHLRIIPCLPRIWCARLTYSRYCPLWPLAQLPECRRSSLSNANRESNSWPPARDAELVCPLI